VRCSAPGTAKRRERGSAAAACLRWLGLSALALVFAVVCPAVAPAAEGEGLPIHRGQPLSEALRALELEGLTLVFTGELVKPEMEVVGEPSSGSPRQILDEILAPHGLSVREDHGVLAVVATARSTAGRTVLGSVRTYAGEVGVVGATVRLVASGQEVAVAVDGSFEIASLVPGVYVLEATAPGFLPQRQTLRVETSETPQRPVFELQAQPFLREEIVVRPSRLSLLIEQPNTSFSLGRDEIDSLPQLGGDLFRTASLFPGVAGGDVTAQFSVHGGRRDEVRVVLDGQELYDAFHLKDYDNALSLVPAESLANAQLTTGSYPVSQGDRMSAVLDLRTIDPQSGTRFLVGASVLDLLTSGSGRFAHDKAGWLVTARRGSLDLAAEAIGKEEPRFWDAQAKLGVTTAHGSITGHLLVSKDELAVDSQEEDTFEVLDNDYESTYGWVNDQEMIGSKLLVGTVGSFARLRRSRGGAASEEKGDFELRDQRDLEVLALTQTWTLDAATHHAVEWGLEARRYEARFDYAKNLEPNFVILAPFAPERPMVHAFDGELTGNHLAGWASDRLSLTERLTAELGLRFDHHELTEDNLWSPRLNLAWRPGQRTVLRAAWGVFYQTQRPYELQVEDGESALSDAERSEHWLLGSESLLPLNSLGLEALRIELYRREIENPRPRSESLLEPLNFFPEIEPDRVRIDPERAGADGIELLLRGRRGRRIDWWLAYSLAKVEDRLEGEQVPRALDQRHTLTLDINYRLGRWNLNAAWRYHTGWPTTPVETELISDPEAPEEDPEVVPVFGALRSERLPVYHRLDVRASRSWRRGSGRWTFFVDVQNLYGRRNLAGFDVLLEEEEADIELAKEHWPGVFPSIGLTWAVGGGAARDAPEGP
jgi:TonB dependent receptor-like, beta-barrel/Carboxypeptidase regulatory-like domain